jgi:hypothetical protein
MRETEISLKKLLDALWSSKILIGVLGFLIIALTGSILYERSDSTVVTIISMKWEGITQGLYPDGSTFEYSEAIEPIVIETAIEELDLSITVDDVRKNMEITPIVPNDVVELIQQALKAGEQYKYYATDYRIEIDSGALELSVSDSTGLLDEIIKAFGADFEETYIEEVDILDFTDTDFTTSEYQIIIDVLETQIEVITDAVIEYENADFNYYGVSFKDVLTKIDLIERIEMEQIITRANSYALAKDKDYLITYYTYQIEVETLELNKLNSEATEIQSLLDNYSGSTTTIVIPGVTTEEDLEIDNYYNTLVEEQVRLLQLISEEQQELALYNLQKSRLDGTDASFNYTPLEIDEQQTIVDNNIGIVTTKLSNLLIEADELLSVYNEETIGDDIVSLAAPEYRESVNEISLSVVGLILGLGIGAVIALFKYDWDKEIVKSN